MIKQELWIIDDSIDDEIYKLARNNFSQCDNQDCLRTTKLKVILDMKTIVESQRENAVEKIDSFFKDNNFKDIMIQWKEQSLNRIRNYCEDAKEKKKHEIERLYNKREVDIMITVMHETHEEELLKKSIELADKLKGQDIDKIEAGQRFEEIWKHFVMESLSLSALNKADIPMQSIFIDCLSDIFNQHHSVLKQELKKLDMLSKQSHLHSLSGSFKATTIDETDLNQKKKKVHWRIPFLSKSHEKPIRISEDRCELIFEILEDEIKSFCSFEKEITSNEVKRFLKFVDEKFNTIKEDPDDSLNVKMTFIIKAVVHVSHYACTKFEAENSRYQNSYGIKARLERYKKQVKDRFYAHLNDRKGEEIAAVLIRHALENNIKEIIRDRMSMKIKRLLREKLPMTKRLLILEILQELVINQSFKSFLTFIRVPKYYADTWIKRISKSILFSSEDKKYFSTAENEIEDCFDDVNQSVSKVVNQQSDTLLPIEKWIESFMFHLEKYKFPKECFRDVIREKNNFASLHRVHFEKNLRTNLSNLKETLLREFGSVSIKTVKWEGNNPIDELCDEIWGCKAQCIFCGEPCILSDVHESISHSCLQHRPSGCRGVYDSNTREISLTSCNYDVASNTHAKCRLYKYLCNPENKCECDQKSHPYNIYRQFLPDWDIEPTTNMEERSKFWMWFIATYKEDIQKHFDIDVSCVPTSWDDITTNEALLSLRMVYSEADNLMNYLQR